MSDNDDISLDNDFGDRNNNDNIAATCVVNKFEVEYQCRAGPIGLKVAVDNLVQHSFPDRAGPYNIGVQSPRSFRGRIISDNLDIKLVLPGDYITHVNGTDTTNMSIADTIDLLIEANNGEGRAFRVGMSRDPFRDEKGLRRLNYYPKEEELVRFYLSMWQQGLLDVPEGMELIAFLTIALRRSMKNILRKFPQVRSAEPYPFVAQQVRSSELFIRVQASTFESV